VNLGPVTPLLSYIHPNPQSDGLGYNPRCIVRDISSYVSTNWTKDSDIYDLIVGYTDVGSFQSRLQGDFPKGYLGIHAGGHFTIGGDPGGDFFVSPGDPYFYLHREWIPCAKYMNQCKLKCCFTALSNPFSPLTYQVSQENIVIPTNLYSLLLPSLLSC
jgi:hypothetical protein